MTLSPGVSAAAISAFSVPITDGSSMKKSHGAQPAVGARQQDVAAVLDAGAERAERVEVRVEPAAADHVAARAAASARGRSARAAGRRAGRRRGCARPASRSTSVDVDPVGAERDRRSRRSSRRARRARASSASIASTSRMRGTLRSTTSSSVSSAGGQQRQRGVLVAGGHDGAGQRHAAFDDELLHERGIARTAGTGGTS